MIYDRVLTVYTLSASPSPLGRRLMGGVQHYYGEKTVFASRFYSAMQAGESADMLLELPRLDEARITANQYCIPEDGKVYRIVQAQYGHDRDGNPITELSLKREEGKYDILGD